MRRIINLKIRILVCAFCTPLFTNQQQKSSSRANKRYSAKTKNVFVSSFKNWRAQLLFFPFGSYIEKNEK